MQSPPLLSSSSSSSTSTSTQTSTSAPLATSPSSSSSSSSTSSSLHSHTNVEQQQQQQQPQVPDGLPVNEAELNTCLAVLQKISAFKGWEKSPSLRTFRKSLFSFSSFPEGILATVVSKTKHKRRKMKAVAALEDRKLLQRCALPAARLQAALKQQAASRPLVPDGPAPTLGYGHSLHPPSLKIEDASEEKEEKEASSSSSSDPASLPGLNEMLCGPQQQIDPDDGEEEGEPEVFLRARNCYVCKRSFHLAHSFYHALCVECGDLNLKKRSQGADLQGKAALVTGARVKIGFHCALKLLRCGAHVVATTRFPKDALLRFSQEQDFAQWQDRLRIYSLDFRDIPAVEAFATHLRNTLPRLDILINNACQTIHRPPGYYQTLVETETRPLEHLLPASHQGAADPVRSSFAVILAPLPFSTASSTSKNQPNGASHAALQSLIPLLPEEDPALNPAVAKDFPKGVVDAQGQQLDLRPKNSWVMTLGEIQTPELLEVFSINACAPFILNGKLRALMASSSSKTDPKFIVNVSAMEGVFNRRWKSPRHPHTNMAKAALNMMTRTSAQDYAADSIYMTSVDTGWINDEKPFDQAQKEYLEKSFQTPLDEIDAASRILDPVFVGLNHGELLSGVFLKDYFPHPW